MESAAGPQGPWWHQGGDGDQIRVAAIHAQRGVDAGDHSAGGQGAVPSDQKMHSIRGAFNAWFRERIKEVHGVDISSRDHQ
jgi:hypothetical protein